MKYVLQKEFSYAVPSYVCEYYSIAPRATKLLNHAKVFKNISQINHFRHYNSRMKWLNMYEVIEITDQELFKAKLAGT